MSFGHLHLILNHIPILALPVVLIFLIYASVKNLDQVKRFSLLMTLVTSIIILPVFFTGEPAEDSVRELPSVSKSVIHEHEESAEVSLVLTLLVCASSLLVLLTYNKPLTIRYGTSLVLLLGFIAMGSLIYTGNLGGKIRHIEFTSEQVE